MSYETSIINPFFAARLKRVELAAKPNPAPQRQQRQENLPQQLHPRPERHLLDL